MTVLDRPRPVAPGVLLLRLVATMLAALLFAAGWTTAKVLLAAVWCVTAVRLGWDDARRPGGG